MLQSYRRPVGTEGRGRVGAGARVEAAARGLLGAPVRGVRRAALVLALWVSIAVAGAVPAVRAASDVAVRAAVEEVFADSAIQTEIPQARGVVRAEVRPPLQAPDGLSEVARFLFWVLVLAGAGLVVFFIAQALPESLRLRRKAASEAEERREAVNDGALSSLEDALRQADRLAKEGRAGEAVHLLLLASLALLRQRVEPEPPLSWTSREVLRAISLPEQAGQSLSRLVGTTEISRFGGRVCSQESYLDCRRSYETFVAALETPS
ncbi:MAG: hypothetical protein MI920_36430 [Kiloniellales bacterium]|nr:hypothetical protein [Kiloniellales bacterium]